MRCPDFRGEEYTNMVFETANGVLFIEVVPTVAGVETGVVGL